MLSPKCMETTIFLQVEMNAIFSRSVPAIQAWQARQSLKIMTSMLQEDKISIL